MDKIEKKISYSTAKKSYFLITAVLFWCGLVVVSSLYITIPLISVFSDVYKVSLSKAAWSSSVFSFCYAIGFLIFGPLSDRYGRKRIIMSGLGALTIFTPIIAFSENWLWFVIVRGMQGIAAATFAPTALAYIADKYPAEKRVTINGFVSTGFLMAGIVGQVVSSFISENFGWNYVFYLLGAVYFITFLLVWVAIPTENIHPATQNISASLAQMGRACTNKNLILCYVITITLLFTFVGMYTALGSYLSEPVFGLDSQHLLYIRCVGIIGMLLSPFAGQFVAKRGIHTMLRGGLSIAIIGLAMLGFCSNLFLITTMTVVFVAGISITIPTLISLVGQLGGTARGSAVSLYTFILFIGATLGPMVTIRLLKTGSYVLTFEMLALLLGVGLACSFFIKHPFHEQGS